MASRCPNVASGWPENGSKTAARWPPDCDCVHHVVECFESEDLTDGGDDDDDSGGGGGDDDDGDDSDDGDGDGDDGGDDDNDDDDGADDDDDSAAAPPPPLEAAMQNTTCRHCARGGYVKFALAGGTRWHV